MLQIIPQKTYCFFSINKKTIKTAEILLKSRGCDIRFYRVNWKKPYTLKQVSLKDVKLRISSYAITGENDNNKWIFEKVAFVSINKKGILFKRFLKGSVTLIRIAPE
jgi:hypothetical protein